MRRTLLTATLLLACATAAGCGGTSSSHDYLALADCLEAGAGGAGLEASTSRDDLDLLAQKAGEGAIHLGDGVQEIQVVVERSASDAEQTANGYRSFGASDDNLHVDGNVVAAFTKAPEPDEKDLVTACIEDPSG